MESRRSAGSLARVKTARKSPRLEQLSISSTADGEIELKFSRDTSEVNLIKHSTVIIYDSRLVITSYLLIFTTLDS